MASSLQTTVEVPLRFSTGAIQPDSTDEQRSAVLLKEITLLDSGSAPLPATLMAVATDHAAGSGNVRAQRAVERFQNAVVDGTQTDMAARLKSAFRAANVEVFEGDSGEISMVAMVARGKYASFATVGNNSAFLYRADRVNQITRNQRTERSGSRKSQQRMLDTTVGSQFLGTQERLDSRLPAVFDLTLLPLDSVALIGGALAEELSQASTGALIAPGQSFGTTIERQIAAADDPEGAATVLDVLPAREALPSPPPEALTTPTYLPYLLIALVLVAGLLLALWFFFA